MSSVFWLGLFLALLGVGCTFLLSKFAAETLPASYLSFNSLLVLTILANALAVRWARYESFPKSSEPWSSVFLSIVALNVFLVYVSHKLKKKSAVTAARHAAVLAGVLYLFFEAHGLGAALASPYFAAGYFLALGSSAFLLGCSLMTMILGHWYLIPYGASFGPLIRGAEFFRMACALRTLVFAFAWLSAWRVVRDGTPLSLWLFRIDGALVFSVARILWGLAAPLALSFLVVKTARLKSNQSATGLLYASLVLVFLGELMAYQLMAQCGFPA